MGCNKSKSQNGRSETDSNGEQRNPWELGQEAQSFYGENFEFNQNENSANGFHFDSGLSYHMNSEQQRSYGHSNVNVTGCFGDSAPDYNLNNGFNGVQYFSTNEHTGNINVYNQNINGPSLSGNSMYTSFHPERLQGHIPHIQQQSTTTIPIFPNQQQYHNVVSQQHFDSTLNQEQVYSSLDNEFIMGPPPTPNSAWSYYDMPRFSRPLVRRRSFNDDYWRSHYQTAHNNTMARHNSLENIRPWCRGEYSRNRFSSVDNHYLFQNSSFGKEGYPRWSYQRQQNSRGQYQNRGVKRNSFDDDSLHSNSAVSDKSESDNMPDAGPNVKRRLSSADDSDSKPTEISNDVDKRGKEENTYNNKTKTTHTNIEELNFDNDEPYDALNLLFFPDEWSSTTMRKTGLVDISLISSEGKAVRSYFSKSSDSKDFKLCITGISRIENPFMHSLYSLKKQEMESRNKHVDELYLFHGTKRENLPSILEDNLNWRLYSENHRFGQGVSFSPLATYSSHYSDKTTVRDMLLFKVLVSNSISGTPDMKIPPTTNAVYDASIKDDTSVIVKYSDNEFYPLYKITYKKVMRTSR